MSGRKKHKSGAASCLKYILIVCNCLFLILSAAVVGVVVYLCIDQIGFIKGLLGTDLVVAAAGLIIGAGCLLFIISVFGIVVVAVENTASLLAYFTFMILLFMTFLSGAICAAVYKTWLTDQARYYMENNIRKTYGINLSNDWNKQVTDSWDRAQTTWKCCSVGDQSWALYQQSEWYKVQPGVKGLDKPYVPSSCCVRDENGKIVDSKECQTKQDGPPATELGNPYAGNMNRALFYRGCYEAAKDYIQNNQITWYTVIIGIGIGLAILMLLGMSLSIALFFVLRREKDMKESATVMMSRYPNGSKTTLETGYYMYSTA